MNVLDTIIEIVILYYNGLSERTLNKRYKKDDVKDALHNPEYKILRDHMNNEKREVFKEHWKTHGLSGMVGGKLE